MKRREFITLLGGVAAATSAPAARAQGDRVRRVAALALAPSTALALMAVLREELQKLGWREGYNLRLDVRIADDVAALQVASEEVVKSAPEVIFALAGPATGGGCSDAHAHHSHRFRWQREPRRRRTGEERCQAGRQHHRLCQHFPDARR
jgi:hypothetical protein